MDRAIASAHGRDGGFATITAVMLCVGLAVVSVALVDLGFQSARRAREEVERESERQALRSAISEVAADLVNQPATVLGRVIKQYGELRVEVVATNELTKADVYRATEEQLVGAFRFLSDLDAREVAANVIHLRAEIDAANRPLEDFLSRLRLESSETACLREWLTVHASSVDPFAVSGAASVSKDGGIVNFRARIVGGRPLDLTRESIAVITGDPQAPLLFLDERTFRTSQIERCSHETS